MKVVIEVDGLKAEASTDYAPGYGRTLEDSEAAKAAVFSRLMNDAWTLAKVLIAAKYAKEGGYAE